MIATLTLFVGIFRWTQNSLPLCTEMSDTTFLPVVMVIVPFILMSDI